MASPRAGGGGDYSVIPPRRQWEKVRPRIGARRMGVAARSAGRQYSQTAVAARRTAASRAAHRSTRIGAFWGGEDESGKLQT